MTTDNQVMSSLSLDAKPWAKVAATAVAIPEPPDLVDLRDPLVRLQELSNSAPLLLIDECDGAVTAIGTVDGVECVLFATDPRRMGGALGAHSCAAIVDAYHRALELDAPIIGIWQSGGARLPEGAMGLAAVGSVFAAMTQASGIIPQISVVLGPAAGGAAYGPALTDIVIVGPAARVFVTGPDIVNSVTGETVDANSLGGPNVHAKSSGLCHIKAATDSEALANARTVVALLSQARQPFDGDSTFPDPGTMLPSHERQAYDVRPLISCLLDSEATELHREWAPNVVTALGRIAGHRVGVIANNPIRMGGCLTAAASEKAARFVRLCDAFGIPLVVLVDVPGYLPGRKQESDGIVRRGAKLLHAFAAAKVPRYTVITRKAYGGAYIAMNSKSLGATAVVAWPTATVDVMSAQAAVTITRRRDIAALPDQQRTEAIANFAAEHSAIVGGLERAVSDGVVDEVIRPSTTRDLLADLLTNSTIVRSRQKNIPL